MTVGQYKSESDPRGYTPTTEDVRDEWRYNIQEVDMDGNVVVSFDEAGAQFDRWLAEHDAKVRAEALREAAAIVADLRPTGLAALTRPGMRSRDAILWEAQSAVQRSAREIEKGAGS